MLIVVTGNNSFKLSTYLKNVQKKSKVAVYKYDGETMTGNDLANAVAGGDLFSAKKTVIIRDLSLNKDLWGDIEKWLARLDQDTTLYLVEPNIDKRTKIYKTIVKLASKHEDFKLIPAREKYDAYEWLDKYAQALGVKIGHSQLNLMVERSISSGESPRDAFIDQWLLHHAVHKLSLMDEVTDDAIKDIMEMPTENNVFELLVAALDKDLKKVKTILSDLERERQAPQMLMGLIVSQVQNLLAISLSKQPAELISQDTGISAYALKSLNRFKNKFSKSQLAKIIDNVVRADERMKTTSDNEWLIIWQLCVNLSDV